jgi:hypothetical protein
MNITAIEEIKEQGIRKEADSLGVVEVPADKLCGAQTQRSLEHFSVGKDLIPREMITSYAEPGEKLDDPSITWPDTRKTAVNQERLWLRSR